MYVMCAIKIQSLITKIKPTPTLFNSGRVVYEVGPVTMYADAGHGAVYLAKNGSILVKDMKGLGICSLGSDCWKAQRIYVKNSDIPSGFSIREKDFIKLENCTLPKTNKKPKPYQPIVKIIYTNKP